MAVVVYNGNASNSAAGAMDLKSEAGYVGLSNQGATCYLNSLLQTLFMTPEFRNAIFAWHYDRAIHGEPHLCIPLQLQRLFGQLALGKLKSVDTVALTKSFGWEGSEVFQQQDVQELTRVLFDALEETFKGTDIENALDQLYAGELIDYLRCIDVDYESERRDKFLDLSLPIIPFGSTRANDSLSECIEMFLRPEILDGPNQYFAESVGRKVDAIKGLKFGKLPQIMSCNLKRFVFDFTGENITQQKLNDIVRFPMILDMNRYVSRGRTRSPSLSLKKSESISSTNSENDSNVVDDDFEVFLREQIDILRNQAKDGNGGKPASSSQVTEVEEDDPTLPDLVDAIGNKIPEQIAEEAKKKSKMHAEEKVWTREEVDKLIAQRGEWVYELFAVLIHSGAIAGGHYYAYIKNLDVEKAEWWNFNDSQVTLIDEAKVREAWGGVTTYTSATQGKITSQSRANAYMLMYRKVLPSSAQPQATVAPSADRLTRYQVPDYIREEINKMEEEGIQKARAAEELRNRMTVKVIWKDTDYMVDTSRRMLYKEFLEKVRSELQLAVAPEFVAENPYFGTGSTDAVAVVSSQATAKVDWPPLDRFRLRFYNSNLKIGADTYDIETDAEKSLDSLNITAYRPLMVETRKIDEVFEKYYPDGVGVSLEELDAENGLFLPIKRLRLPKSASPADLIDRIAAWLPYPKDELLLIKCSPQNYYDAKFEIIPYTHALSLKDHYYIHDYVRVVYEHMPEIGDAYYAAHIMDYAAEAGLPISERKLINRTTFSMTGITINGELPSIPNNEPLKFSKAVKAFINQRCRVNVIVNKPPEVAFAHRIPVDQRDTVGSLRALIAGMFGLEASKLRLIKNSAHGLELRDDKIKLSNAGIYDNLNLYVVIGSILPVGSYAIAAFALSSDVSTKLNFLPKIEPSPLDASVLNAADNNTATSSLSLAENYANLAKSIDDEVRAQTASTLANLVSQFVQKPTLETWETGSDDSNHDDRSYNNREHISNFRIQNTDKIIPTVIEHDDNQTDHQKHSGNAAIEITSALPIDCLTPVIDGENSNVIIAEPVDLDSIDLDLSTVPFVEFENEKFVTEIPDEEAVKTEDDSSASASIEAATATDVDAALDNVEANDFAERTSHRSYSQSNFKPLTDLDLSLIESDLVWDIKVKIWNYLKSKDELISGQTPSHIRLREKMSMRPEKIFRDGLTKEDVDAMIAAAAAEGTECEFQLTPEMRSKCKTVKDCDIRLFDMKQICITVLEDPEYLDPKECRGDAILFIQYFDRSQRSLTSPIEVYLPGNMLIRDIAKGLASMFQIANENLRVLPVMSTVTVALRYLHEDLPRGLSKSWFNPALETKQLCDLYFLHTGDVLILQDISVPLRPLTRAESLSISLVDAAEKTVANYARYGTAVDWLYNDIDVDVIGPKTGSSSSSRSGGGGIKIKVHKTGSTVEDASKTPTPTPDGSTGNGVSVSSSTVGAALFQDIMNS